MVAEAVEKRRERRIWVLWNGRIIGREWGRVDRDNFTLLVQIIDPEGVKTVKEEVQAAVRISGHE